MPGAARPGRARHGRRVGHRPGDGRPARRRRLPGRSSSTATSRASSGRSAELTAGGVDGGRRGDRPRRRWRTASGRSARRSAWGGRLDVLVNCAGVWVEGPSDTMTEADWDRVVDVNLKGDVLHVPLRDPGPRGDRRLHRQRRRPMPGCGATRARRSTARRKGGVDVLTKALAVELAARGVRANVGLPRRRRLADDPLPGRHVRRRRSGRLPAEPAGRLPAAPGPLHPPGRGRRAHPLPDDPGGRPRSPAPRSRSTSA